MTKTALGHDSHAFEPEGSSKPLVLGGVRINGCVGLKGNSDADVVLHAVTNAISGISGVNILGKIADEMCLQQGITDSREYVKKALETVRGFRVSHLSISLEGKRPILSPHFDAIRASLSGILKIATSDIGLTATSGEGLTAFGRGEGLQVFAVMTVEKSGDQ
jgi:2-C-methyl-D-erythritol 2,4-cyclodiphosphate synthase